MKGYKAREDYKGMAGSGQGTRILAAATSRVGRLAGERRRSVSRRQVVDEGGVRLGLWPAASHNERTGCAYIKLRRVEHG